jgi:hypothetical protein
MYGNRWVGGLFLAERMPNETAITALQVVQTSVRDENANIF